MRRQRSFFNNLLENRLISLDDQIKVVAMSDAVRAADVPAKVSRLGALDFIKKSFQPSDLLNRE